MKSQDRKKMRRIAVLAVLLLWAWVASPAWAATVSLSTRPDQLKDHEFSVTLKVGPVTGAYGLVCDVLYDPQFLQVVETETPSTRIRPTVEEGLFFNQGQTQPTLIDSAVQDDVPGTLVLGLTRSGDLPGVDANSGQPVLTLHFLAKKLGTTTIQFARHDMVSPELAPLDVSAWEGATVRIVGAFAGDINNDAFVDLADAILALKVMAGINGLDLSLAGEADGNGVIGFPEAEFALQTAAGLR